MKDSPDITADCWGPVVLNTDPDEECSELTEDERRFLGRVLVEERARKAGTPLATENPRAHVRHRIHDALASIRDAGNPVIHAEVEELEDTIALLRVAHDVLTLAMPKDPDPEV